MMQTEIGEAFEPAAPGARRPFDNAGHLHAYRLRTGQTACVMEGLQVDAWRMRHNLEATHGLIMAEAISAALAPKLGRDAARSKKRNPCATP